MTKQNIKDLKKLQKHLNGLKLVKTRNKNNKLNMNLPDTIRDKKRFSINNWEFNCGMPACVAGHAKVIFLKRKLWKNFGGICNNWRETFRKFFGLNFKEFNYICEPKRYKSLNPTPKTAAKHIQEVLDNKFN